MKQKITLIASLFLLLTVSQGFCQAKFQSYFGSRAEETLESGVSDPVVETPDGSYVCMGNSTRNTSSGTDIVVSKINAKGEKEWLKMYGGDKDDVGYAIQQLPDGYLISGESESYTNGKAAYLIKINLEGDYQWSKTFKGVDLTEAINAKPTDDGGILIAGNSRTPDSSHYNMHIIKLDDQQNVQWERIIGKQGFTKKNFYAWDFIEVSDGYVLAGKSSELSGIAPNFNVIEDGRLVKLNDDGSLAWYQKYDHPSLNPRFRSLQKYNNKLYVLGSVDTTERDIMITEMDLSGNVNWTKAYGGAKTEGFSEASIAADGTIHVYGSTESYGAGKTDQYYLQLANKGQFQNAKTYGTSAEDFANGGLQTWDGGHALMGYTANQPIGGQDFYLVKTDTTANAGCQEQNGGAKVKTINLTKQSLPDSSYTISSTINNPATQTYPVSMQHQQECSECVYSSKAAFKFSKTSSNQFTFTNNSMFGATYKWTFGDGDSSRMAEPSHTYSNDQEYTVCLIAYNACNTDTICKQVNTSTGIDNAQPSKLSVYPNPAEEAFSIVIKGQGTTLSNVKIFNSLGQVAYTNQITNSQLRIKSTDWKPGVYFVKTETGNGSYHTQKIVIE